MGGALKKITANFLVKIEFTCFSMGFTCNFHGTKRGSWNFLSEKGARKFFTIKFFCISPPLIACERSLNYQILGYDDLSCFLLLFLFCFVLFCFVLFCFVLFCFVLFCFCFVLPFLITQHFWAILARLSLGSTHAVWKYRVGRCPNVIRFMQMNINF